ncbi:two component, sigma54 specific, transcriptional regulator, Fis family [Desulfosporosinus sp. I2]|uniref:sigma-54-dependent Fis family transcriptional regulator n=1 Tax=Desulfosporosinus sp. I2 TaxID=1617025 RepID=UPI00061EEB96|nr:sigma-54-dependent Fis family transcriptional regulator [Desulfosporosinus sp. I2]KJR48038.1 two component, sigma54 specific, transcriptional regulator, Fis family [Desulfosporosinus sp. I2]
MINDEVSKLEKQSFYPRIQDSWKNFVEGQSITSEVRQIIVDSWHNSVKKGISPFQKKVNRVQSEKEIIYNESLNRDLIDVSLPVMENLYKFVAGSGFTVTLIDNKGIILKIIGDQEVVRSISKGNFIIGADWSEESAGTNAIGLALKLNQPVQVISYEHFCICSHNSTCSAAPIHDTEGNIMGILDMTGDFEKAHSHTLGMVVASVHGIEKQLETKYAWEKYNLANSYLNAIVESVSEGMMAVNEAGIITHINSCAIKMLEGSKDEIIGRNFRDHLKSSFLIENKKDLSGLTDREVDIISNGKVKKAIISSRKIEGLPSGMKGAVLVFNEINRTRKLVQRMSGLEAKLTFKDILGRNEMFLKTVRLAENAARSHSNILLLGESGTGKDVFAQAIHNASHNSNGPFVAINCGAIPRELISSELFGYVDGAFTGAKRGGNPGKFEMAEGGTIFLDEIGEMPLELQTILLRVIENKSIMRIGGQDSIPVNVRIIAATNRDLIKEVDRGNFRRDLYYRLNVISIKLLPLREHKDDIPLLCEHFIKKMNHQLEKDVNGIEDEVQQCFNAYEWPGNIRELYNILERSMNIAQSSKLSVNFLPSEFTTSQNVKNPVPHNSFEELEKELISNLMTEHSGNITRIANKLGVARTTLYRKLDKYDLNQQ